MSARRSTLQERYDVVWRELRRRARDYPVRIANHRMTRLRAEREYLVMLDVVRDYADALADMDIPAEPPEPSLFEGAGSETQGALL